MSRKWIAFALSLLLWTSACSPASIFSLTPTPTAYIYPTAVTPTVPALTVDQLKNMEYIITGLGSGASLPFQFTDGKFQRGTDPAATDYASLSLLDIFAFGDLNNDGVNDAAVLIAENYGGTGVFVSVAAVLNENGQPRHVASYLIDDRPQVNSMEIRDGEIFLDAVVHSPSDAACCPTQEVTRSFQLSSASLTLVHATSRFSGGQERVVTIESPLDGAQTHDQLVISGSVTIAPFENTLTYHIYNEQGNELLVGPIMVNAPDVGAPGTFTLTLDTIKIPVGRVRIVVADLSAADGSVLALDSVEVVIQ